MTRRAIIIFLWAMMIPSAFAAGPTIPGFYGKITTPLPVVAPNALPVLKPQGSIQGLDPNNPYTIQGANKATVNQVQPQAVIDWNSFNIGQNASVYFNQQGNSTWAALNRIWDLNPTQIFGRLTADGQIYLINQNGILFGPGSQVNVHTLVASSLNIQDNDFLNNTLHFTAQNYNGRTDNLFYDSVNNIPGTVSNTGTIQTDNMGSVFLLGPNVENCGIIVAPNGQIGLAAGTDIELDLPPLNLSGTPLPYPSSNTPGFTGESRSTFAVTVNSSPVGSVAWNREGGVLSADTGLVGMYGRIVNQDGLIRSVTAVQKAGHVELFASDTITTGPNSMIWLPVSDSPDTVDSSFQTSQSSVIFSGLDASSASNPTVFTNLILHQGAIIAPSGYVSLNAANRVYLASGSKIDVSGAWVDQPASAAELSLQMNSVNLRDAYLQKGGVLQGQDIQMSAFTGSAIGDVSGAYTVEGSTAMQRHTVGGAVSVNAGGDIIMREGALVDFSGGGIRYAAGAVDSTKLLSGNKIYDISNASPNLIYSGILNVQTFAHPRYGITEEYDGIYYGGASPLNNSTPAYTVGNDAGLLQLLAPQVVLDGTILGGVTKGLQQTWNPSTLPATPDLIDETLNREPIGGKLTVGNTEVINGVIVGDTINFITREIVVSPVASLLPSGFQPTDLLPYSQTFLSSQILSDAGLSALSLAANTSITVQKGAQMNLVPGGSYSAGTGTIISNAFSFTARARRIENYGAITVPGGNINLSIETDLTTNSNNGTNPNYIPLGEVIYLAGGSSLVASGQRIDNTAAAASGQGIATGHINGGSIQVLDKTVTGQGVAIMPGALIDVSGGYQIDAKGNVTGGNAGSVTLQGYSLIVDGDLRALSLVGSKGGSITMHAGNVSIVTSPPSIPDALTADSPWPQNLIGQLVLGADQLDGTGFSSITLKSVNDIVMENGTSLGPSLAKLAAPMPGQGIANLTNLAVNAVQSGLSTILVTPDYIGTSSITLSAGTAGSFTSGEINQNGPMNPSAPNYLATIKMLPGATVQVTPAQNSIQMTAPYIDIAGTINAPAGNITLTSRSGSASGSLTLEAGAKLFAEGYTKPDTAAPVKGLPVNTTPLAGGTITLTAGTDLIVSPGSLMSVSGSSPVSQAIVGPDGSISSIINAGQPGSIFLSAAESITLGGTLAGRGMIEGLPGGTLSISTSGSSPLSLSTSDLVRFHDGGFDAISLASSSGLNLTGSGAVAFGRTLTVDAPFIAGSAADRISLSAPWIQLTNSTIPSASSPAKGGASLTLASTWLDVTGAVTFSGFNDVHLEATRDIRFSDALYTINSQLAYEGLLATSADLTLQAGRIYPTTLSWFAPHDNVAGGIVAGGKVTILPSDTPVEGPIYSAGGGLTIQAGTGIEQRGFLAAPMGTLSLQTGDNSRIYLADGSVTTTRASVPVLYGVIQQAQDSGSLGDNIWAIPDKQNPNSNIPFVALQNAPDKSISITGVNGSTASGVEVIVQSGAVLDVSGGGSVFAYRFLPSQMGSTDPLLKAGTYVIVPDNTVVLPGAAVQLTATKGLIASGTYSLITPDSTTGLSAYAFVPGAMVVTDLGPAASLNNATVTKDGYPVVLGYPTTMGTGIRSRQLEAYEIRPAADVLSQGYFEQTAQVAGGSGSVTLAGNTTILSGTVQANPLPGFSGGSIALSGKTVTVQSSAIPLPAGFDFSTPVPLELAGTLTIAAPSLSGNGFDTIGLGFSNLANPSGSIAASTVTLKAGTLLQAETIILAAKDLITLEPGAQVLALAAPGQTGQATLISPSGKAVIGPGALIHASDTVSLQTGSVDLDPTAKLLTDHSTINLQASTITFVPDGYVRSPQDTGLLLTQSQWNSLASIDNITLASLSDLVFDGTFYLPATGSLTIDAARIFDSVTGSTVSVGSVGAPIRVFTLQNTTGATPGSATAKIAQTIGVTSQEMVIGGGNVLFDGFSSVNLVAQNNLTFKGIGSLQTGGSDLNISTARVTTSYSSDAAGNYTAANFTINAGSTGTVTLQTSGGTPGTSSIPGGKLAINAREIDISTLVEIPSGQLTLTASDSITVRNGSSLLLPGTDYAPGGIISLTSTNGGAVNLEAGSLIDVSAGGQGDAGTINLYGPTGGVILAGELRGQAGSGAGGSLSLVTSTISDFAALNTKLAGGGFNSSLNLEATLGDITIPAGGTVRGRSVTMTADSGSINLSPASENADGTTTPAAQIDVSQPDKGGTVELYAQQNLSMSGTILARGTGANAPGGNVTLGTATGVLTLNGSGLIDVSGSGTGTGGTVIFRDPPPPAPAPWQVNMALAGTINGASSVVAEIDRVYADQYPQITQAVIDAIQSDVSSFMNNYSGSIKTGLLTSLGGVYAAQFHVQPGVVIEQTAGDLTLSQDWDLTGWRYGGETGTLTLRAAGNLNVNANIIDNPTNSYSTLRSDNAQPSWGINLVAGARTDSPDLLAVNLASQGGLGGSLTISSALSGNQKVVYTETGPIRFASGGDTVINQGPANNFMIAPGMTYSLATYSGAINGNVGANLTIYPGGAIQSATGSIDLGIGKNLNLVEGTIGGSAANALGSIRTTGERPTGAAWSATRFYNYGGGGSITLNVGGSISGQGANGNLIDALDPNAWLVKERDTSIRNFTHYNLTPLYMPSYSTTSTDGIITMAGGDLSIWTGGFFNAQAGTFGKGDLRIYSGGDLKGRFLVRQGTGELITMGNFGSSSEPQLIEMSDAKISVSAQGNVNLDTVLNPNLAAIVSSGYWDNLYTPDSSVRLTAVTGSVNIYGAVDTYRYGSFYQQTAPRDTYLPPTFEISAGTDIVLSGGWGGTSYIQMPAPDGQLSLTAGRDILFSGKATLTMSDADPTTVYHPPTRGAPDLGSHAAVPVHIGDPVPARITAGRNIQTMDLTVPKMTEISAGQDITDLNYTGQNVAVGDVTTIQALGNILYGYASGSGSEHIQMGGPGYLLVEAGGRIDLGYSDGIQAIGNSLNPALSEKGGSVTVAAGFSGNFDLAGVEGFFDSLHTAGDNYTVMQQNGDAAGAKQVVDQARANIIKPFLGSGNRAGDITMTSSQISTVGGGSLSVLTAGDLNVGTTFLHTQSSNSSSQTKNTGILTETGGGINVFATGDVNVNEARLMTFLGGDITVWSDFGNINAGKGDKATVNLAPPTWSKDPVTGLPKENFSPPAVGSGIRALTYAPGENIQPPPAGDLYIFAPNGIIDAGEAGISGRNVTLGATAVLNAVNISFSAGSVGVPAGSQGVSLGALSGTTSFAEKGVMSQDTGALGAAQGKVGERPVEDIVAKWIDVKVTGFDLSRGVGGGSEDEADERNDQR